MKGWHGANVQSAINEGICPDNRCRARLRPVAASELCAAFYAWLLFLDPAKMLANIWGKHRFSDVASMV